MPGRLGRALVALLAATSPTAPAVAQMPVPSPALRPPASSAGAPSGIEGQYGTAEPEDLSQVAYNTGPADKKNVRVHGVLGDLVVGRYFALADGTARVMLIPFEAGDYRDYAYLMGADVEITGIVRVLPAQQKTVPCLGQMLPESKCADPLLPELPNLQTGWPPVSITIVSLSDRGAGRRPPHPATRTLADAGTAAAVADGKPVTTSGQFRGSNLCGDLPAGSRREAADWVLLTAEGPLWVTGRRPEGSGFQLDPAQRADTSRWLEVRGKLELAGETRYLRASRVALVPRPSETAPAPCPR
jgi:hypothetical protein